MQRTAQEVFIKINELKKELREKRTELKEYFLTDSRYAQTEEELSRQKEKKLQLTEELKAAYPDLTGKIDQIKLDLESEKELFSDMILTQVMKGEKVELKDQYEQLCFPIFSVKMKAENSL